MSGPRCGKVEEGTGVREEVVSGILGVDASFEGVPYERNFSLGKRKRIASRDLQHLLTSA